MANDPGEIAERLRGAGQTRRESGLPLTDIYDIAADEIERLIADAAATRSALRQLLDALKDARFTQDHATFTAEARIKYAQAKEAAERVLVSDKATL